MSNYLLEARSPGGVWYLCAECVSLSHAKSEMRKYQKVDADLSMRVVKVVARHDSKAEA